MAEIDIIICLKKEKKIKKIPKSIMRPRSLNLVINEIAFKYINLIVHD